MAVLSVILTAIPLEPSKGESIFMQLVTIIPLILILSITVALVILYFKWNKPVSGAMKISISTAIAIIALWLYLPILLRFY